MDVVCDEGGLEASDESVRYDADRQQEDRSDDVHAGEGIDSGSTSRDEHQRHEHVGQDAKDDKGEVGRRPVAGLDDLEESVGVGGARFLSMMASVAKRRICTVAPEAYQKGGPETPYR